MSEDPITNKTKAKSPEEKQIEFEKFKSKIELFKWLIASVALVIVTMVIDYGFRDRAAGLQEIQQYDKYVTELIILNKEPGQKRMLAQFFANVTPSEKLKKGWKNYFAEVDKEYQKYIAPVLKNDSILQIKYELLSKTLDTSNTRQIEELQHISNEMKNNERIIHPEIILPQNSLAKNNELALDWEIKGFNYLLAHDVDNAIMAFVNSENASNGFHQVYEIAKFLKENRNQLKDRQASLWKNVLLKIANDFDWKMNDEIKSNLIENAKKI